MFTPLRYLTDLFRTPSPPIPHKEDTELIEAVNEVGEIIILEMPIKEKRVSSPLYLAPEFLFEP
jgi:hypothetical protein